MTTRSTAPKPDISDSLLEIAAGWVARTQDPESTEADFAQWEEWLKADPSHAAAYAAAEEVWTLAARIDPPWPTHQELAEQARNESSAPQRATGRWRPRIRRMSMAAAVALIGVSGWLVWVQRPTVLETMTGEQRSLLLADGSRVTLGAETRLIVEHSSNRRTLKLDQGEAYFEVAHDPKHPFVVRVGDHEAVAVGTAFDINAVDDRLMLTVTEGVVKLRAVESEYLVLGVNPDVVSTLQLGVGERAAADRNGTEILPKISQPEEAVAWRSGRFDYRQEALQTVIQDVNRYTHRKIKISDPSIGQLRFTGTVFVDQLDGWLAALQGTFPIEVRQEEDMYLLVPSPAAAPTKASPRPPTSVVAEVPSLR